MSRRRSLPLRALGSVLIGAAAIGMTCAAILAILPLLIPEATVRARIDEQVRRWTGGALELRLQTRIELRPGFDIMISEPVFVPADGAAPGWTASAGSVEAKLRLGPLLAGRIEIADLRLVRPDITLPDGAALLSLLSPPAFVTGSTPDGGTLSDAGGRPTPPGNIVLVDGVLRLAGEGDAEAAGRVFDVDLALAAPDVSDGVAVTAGFVVDGSRVDLEFWMDEPDALASENGTPGTLSVDIGRRVATEGGNTLDGPGVGDRVLRLVGGLGLPGLDTVVVEGRYSLDTHAASIEEATLSIGNVSLDGHLRLGWKPGLPLASQVRILKREADAAIRAAAGGIRDGDWTDAPIALDWLEGFDIDLALSGDAIGVGTIAFDTAALSFAADQSGARLDLAGEGESVGSISATLAARPNPEEPESALRFEFNARAEDLSVGETARFVSDAAFRSLIGTPQLPEGTLSGEIDLVAAGDTPGQLLSSARGSARATLSDGSLAGGDVVMTLQSLSDGREFMTEEKGPLIPAAGRTPFDTIETQVDLADGAARILGNTIAGERFEIAMAGSVDLRGGAMNVAGNALLFDDADDGEDPADIAVDLPFGLGGTLFGPVVAAGVPTVRSGLSEDPTRPVAQ